MRNRAGVGASLDGKKLRGAIENLASGPASDPTGDAPVLCRNPVFLLAAGWRSGSTLVQRLIASGGPTLVWGEPIGDCAPIHRMSQMLEPYARNDPHSESDIDHFEGTLSDAWIANLNPGQSALRRAHLAWFETFFAEPARARGYSRWGCKWVRLTANHAHYLRWLYPEAKLVFLVRHPLDALRSYLGQRALWYLVRPKIAIRTPDDFLTHWARVAESFLSESESLGAPILRYEDIISAPEAATQLAEHLEQKLDPGLIATKLGATPPDRGSVPISARLAARYRYAALLSRFGYDTRGGAPRSGPQ